MAQAPNQSGRTKPPLFSRWTDLLIALSAMVWKGSMAPGVFRHVVEVFRAPEVQSWIVPMLIFFAAIYIMEFSALVGMILGKRWGFLVFLFFQCMSLLVAIKDAIQFGSLLFLPIAYHITRYVTLSLDIALAAYCVTR